MKVTIFNIEDLKADLREVMVGGMEEEIFSCDFDIDEKVKKGKLSLHLKYNCNQFITMEEGKEIFVSRCYKKKDYEWSLVKESIEVNTNIIRKNTFIHTMEL
tara:strand:+ start:383 stop:688 length:306 start_codon:yes stop_codon:yes gene_type:complete